MQSLKLTDYAKIVTGIPSGILATTVGDGDWVSLKNYPRLTIILTIDNGTTVTGTAVLLKQATDVSGSGIKNLPFSTVLVNIDTGANDDLVVTPVVADTFTTDTTNAKNLKYVMEITADMLDQNNGFTSVRIDCLLMANALGNVEYILHHGRNVGASAIID